MPSEGSDTVPASAYEGPGAWGTAAMWLLVGLLVLGAALTVHSIVVTFGG